MPATRCSAARLVRDWAASGEAGIIGRTMPHHTVPVGALFVASVLAQSPPPWSTIAVPGGIAATAVASQGKIATLRAGAALHAYSAVTRQFQALPLTPSATVRLNNDCLLVLNPATWTAYSAWTGSASPLAVSAGAALVNPAGAVNDSLLLVIDGNQLHAFSAFTGTWLSRTVGPAWSAAVQRHVAVLADGIVLGGLDAYTGQWTDMAAGSSTGMTLSADGTAGFAVASGTVHAFSASHRTWRSASLPSGAASVRADDWGVYYTATRMLGYSAIRGTFATSDRGATMALGSEDTFGILSTAAGPVAFSAFTGSFSAPLATPGAAIATGTAVALLRDAAGAHAYSAVLGSTAIRANASLNQGAANVIAWVGDNTTGLPAFFSALTGRWYDSPASVLPVAPTLTTTSAAALTPTGCLAFVPRSGRFAPLVDSTILTYGNGNSAPLLAVGATDLYGFDARTETWFSTPRASSGPVQVNIWRTAALAIDGAMAFAFGTQAGTWSSQLLPGPVAGLRVNSESLRLHTANDYFAWSAMAEVAPYAQFPEFRRVQPATQPIPLRLVVPSGGFAVLAVGNPATAPVSLPTLGLFWLEPTNLATLLVPGRASGEPVPCSLSAPGPSLAGHEFGLQAALWSTGSNLWLSELAAVLPLGG